MKKRIIFGPALMIITILVITGFQVYWLKDNYDREKRTMQIKTNVAFQETVHQLQAAKLRFPGSFPDPNQKMKTRVFVDDGFDRTNDDGKLRRSGIVTMVNNLRDKMVDSLKTPGHLKSTFVISLQNGSQIRMKDSATLRFTRRFDTSNHIYKILYGVDSLQDSIKLPELTKRYEAELKKENLVIPFNITKTPGLPEDDNDMSLAPVGFVHPVTYHLVLQNTGAYLLKKLSLPILFSVFLIGVTILSFVILYRNLLRQQRLAEIKNEFISNITHELKTPIATVSVAIEALKNFNAIHDPEKTKEYLDISGNELQRLSLLVDKVLKLSMFEKKQIELTKEVFDLKILTQEVLDSMRLQFEKNNAVVNFNTHGDQFIVTADKLHITSVIYNLLDNALKYSKDEPVINVELSVLQNTLELKVTDNGIGIAPEYRSKIFDKFFRVPTGNRHAVKGYGLGLSYVSEIIKRHDGSINVESELGKESTFTVELPV